MMKSRIPNPIPRGLPFGPVLRAPLTDMLLSNLRLAWEPDAMTPRSRTQPAGRHARLTPASYLMPMMYAPGLAIVNDAPAPPSISVPVLSTQSGKAAVGKTEGGDPYTHTGERASAVTV